MECRWVLCGTRIRPAWADRRPRSSDAIASSSSGRLLLIAGSETGSPPRLTPVPGSLCAKRSERRCMHPLADLARPLSFKASYDTSGTWNFGVDLTETTGGGVRPRRVRGIGIDW